MEAYMATAGAHAVNYPVLEIIPLYVDASAAPLPAAPVVIADVAGMKICSGSYVIAAAIGTGGSSGAQAVTFPVGFFSAPPLSVFAMPGNGRLTPSYQSLTKDGVSLFFNNWSSGASTTNVTVLWTAIGV
jgi:hypothetical protein